MGSYCEHSESGYLRHLGCEQVRYSSAGLRPDFRHRNSVPSLHSSLSICYSFTLLISQIHAWNFIFNQNEESHKNLSKLWFAILQIRTVDVPEEKKPKHNLQQQTHRHTHTPQTKTTNKHKPKQTTMLAEHGQRGIGYQKCSEWSGLSRTETSQIIHNNFGERHSQVNDFSIAAIPHLPAKIPDVTAEKCQELPGTILELGMVEQENVAALQLCSGNTIWFLATEHWITEGRKLLFKRSMTPSGDCTK